jgi:hypothetical protein
MGNRTITDGYYKNHLSILEGRLEKAGIRLAGVLNQIFESSPYDGHFIPPSAEDPPPQKNMLLQDIMSVEDKDARNHVGETVQICAQVYDSKVLGR